VVNFAQTVPGIGCSLQARGCDGPQRREPADDAVEQFPPALESQCFVGREWL
jgi:hypothetical protein